MRLGEGAKMQASINVTPLVDVVLVLLIIFMVMAPQMRKGPEVRLPKTEKPTQQGDERGRILVSIDEAGGLWVNDKQVAAAQFGDALRAAVAAETDPKVVIRGDAKLNFRQVREAMQAVEQAGFRGVGLIAKGRNTETQGEQVMEFNRGDSGSNLQSEINITPLVDVVLVLLIIFMVVVPLLMQGYDVNIPKTSTNAKPAQSEDSRLTLVIPATTCTILKPSATQGVPADCRVILNDQKIAATELPARVGDILGSRPPDKRVLFLAADDRLNYEGVLRILDLAKSGVEDLKVEFITAN